MTFVVGTKQLEQLLQWVKVTGVFEAQCITTDPELLATDDYKAFLRERRARIAGTGRLDRSAARRGQTWAGGSAFPLAAVRFQPNCPPDPRCSRPRS